MCNEVHQVVYEQLISCLPVGLCCCSLPLSWPQEISRQNPGHPCFGWGWSWYPETVTSSLYGTERGIETVYFYTVCVGEEKGFYFWCPHQITKSAVNKHFEEGSSETFFLWNFCGQHHWRLEEKWTEWRSESNINIHLMRLLYFFKLCHLIYHPAVTGYAFDFVTRRTFIKVWRLKQILSTDKRNRDRNHQ